MFLFLPFFDSDLIVIETLQDDIVEVFIISFKKFLRATRILVHTAESVPSSASTVISVIVPKQATQEQTVELGTSLLPVILHYPRKYHRDL